MKRFAIAAGGTGGHLFPGLAVAEVLHGWGHRVLLLTSEKHIDAVATEGRSEFQIARLPGMGLPRGITLETVKFFARFARGILHCRSLFADFQPAAVLGMGGFTSIAPILAGRLSGLTVSQMEWKISPELLAQTETKVQGQAVAQWRAKADALTQQLGFSRYTVGEVTLGSPGSGQSFGPRAMPMAMMDASPDARGAPIPVQAGLAQVTVVVSGHVLLQ